MRTIEYKVSYENMISRIPGLFAYLDSDELGEVSLHHAYDSNCGCYGKIVENIKLPKETSLKVDDNVLLEGGQTYTFRTIITYYYQYRDLFTKYVYKTRPITVEEYRNLDARKQRLYERQIDSEFIKFVEKGIGKNEIPFDKYNKFVNNSNLYVNICKDNDVITKERYEELSKEEQKNYRLKKNENVPKFIYLANVISLYNELVKMSKQCTFYQDNIENFGNDKHMCCLCERYINMGGDGLRDYVGSLIEKYKEISNEYFGYADNEKSMTLDFDIDLVSSYDDMGIMDSYIAKWIPYKKYYKGDRVFYDGSIWHYEEDNTGYYYEDTLGGIWRCEENNTGYFNEDEMKVVFSDRYFKKVDNVFEKIDNKNLVKIEKNTFKITGQTDSKLKDLRRFVTYMNDDNIGEKPENGYDWLFYYRIGNICNISTLNDNLGNILKLDGETASKIEDGNDLMAYGDVITNITSKAEEKTITFEYIINAHLTSKTHSSKLDEDKNVIHYWKDFTYEKNTGVKYTETYNYAEDSDLDNLINGKFKLGIKTEDGKVVLVIYLGEEEIKIKIEEWKPNEQYYIGDRVSYKGIIWRCTVDNKESVFNDDYFVEVVEEVEIKEWTPNTQYHRCDRVFYDDRIWRCIKDNQETEFNEDYFEEIETNIKKWETDKQYHIGDKVFYDGGIWRCTVDNTNQTDFNEDYFEKIVEEEFTFENYVDGKYDDNLKSFKFEFITFNNELNYYKTIANQEVNIVSTLTDFEVFKNDNDEFMEVYSMADDEFYTENETQKQRGIHMFRHDYFNGITYAPTKKIDVHVERGSTSCFQRHIGFSEIKTLNDMVEYRNGSFFKINEG